jgi:hypothetical protein
MRYRVISHSPVLPEAFTTCIFGCVSGIYDLRYPSEIACKRRRFWSQINQ